MPSKDDEARALSRAGSEIAPGLRLGRLLAIGELGAVYAAESKSRGAVAVKVFHAELGRHVDRELLRLLRLAEELGHPRIVMPLEVLTRPDALATVMPRISGESAMSLTRRRKGRIPPSEALRIACDVLELIGTAHAHEVRHGALSLSHVMLDDDGAAQLLGFGEARLRAELGLFPDRAFMPPGHDPSRPSVDADLWAIGTLLFGLLTGRIAHAELSLGAVTHQAPRALVELLDRALSPDPSRRFADAGTMLAAMRIVLASREVQYAHPLASSLSGSGMHAMVDLSRLVEPPRADPTWSSTPPATPAVKAPSRPSSSPPATPRSRLAPSIPPEVEPQEPRVSQPPPSVRPRGTTPPSGTPVARPERAPASLPSELDCLARLPEAEASALRAEKDKLVRLHGFDSSLSLEDAWQSAKKARPAGGAIEAMLAELGSELARGERAESELALELSGLGRADPDRLVHVTASSLEGPALGPALEAFGPALRAHLEALAEREPASALGLVTTLVDAVRAPKAILPTERGRVISAVAAPGVVRTLFARLGVNVSDARALDTLGQLVPLLGPAFAGELAAVLSQISDLTLRAKVLHHLESELTSHERSLGELAKKGDARLGIEVARILGRIDTLAAREALQLAAESPHAVVRIEALGLGGGAASERLRAELKRRLEDAPASERIAVLRALADHEVKVAAPFLALRAKSKDFDGLPLEERRALLHALAVLSPARAEALAIELLEQKKLLSTGAHEDTRALAAGVLGEVSQSQEAMDTLAHHAERHIGTSDRVRQAAARALELVQARKGQ